MVLLSEACSKGPGLVKIPLFFCFYVLDVAREGIAIVGGHESGHGLFRINNADLM